MHVSIIINPVAGPRRRTDAGGPRAAMAERVLRARGLVPHIDVTASRGHARLLAAKAVEAGGDLVIAWGGDGTVSEVAGSLANTRVSLGIVPSGSGNGLARELGVPRDAEAALAHALDRPARRIDAGLLGGHLFVNIAGVGLDAQIAKRFNTLRSRNLGLMSYLGATVSELWRFSPERCTVDAAETSFDGPMDLVVFANSGQYGNGARIAPCARVDDGALDLVIAEHGRRLGTLWRARRLFDGSVLRDPRVTHLRVERATVTANGPLAFHVDGEPMTGPPYLEARVLKGVLLVNA
jgi:YegS/Rv2252/BmrU family lipid kinase